jgi:hypothetical protein
VAATYDTSALGTSDLFQTRLLIRDTDVSTDPQFQDEEITFMLTERGSIYGAAASLCRILAAKFAKEVDTSDRDIRDSLSQRSASYLRMAKEYEGKAGKSSGGPAVLVAGLPDCYVQ